MSDIRKTFTPAAARLLKNGAIAVIPTDTIYGIVASALLPAAVEKLYRLRRRTPTKPMIILISSIADLKKFGIVPPSGVKNMLSRLWPGPVSVIMANRRKKFTYLDRGTGTLAFRLPADPVLRKFLKIAGPLVAPSANHEGAPAAKTVAQARHYFSDSVDFYIDTGICRGMPSTVISLEGNKATIVRAGALSLVSIYKMISAKPTRKY